MYSLTLQSLLEAVAIIETARKQVTSIEFAWKTLHEADKHLQAQIAEQFSEVSNG